MLNIDQLNAVTFINTWWKSRDMYAIVEGEGGTGKSFLVDSLLKTLPDCTPVLLAPTNEALGQLREKLSGDYLLKTVHSALGISPILQEKKLSFEQTRIPSFWQDYNLAIIDEAGMLSDVFIQLLITIGIKILYIGHRSQLPPIEVSRKLTDPCISPIFNKEYPLVNLTIPVRHTGKLYEFNKIVEKAIYDTTIVIPDYYDITKTNLNNYIKSREGKLDFITGKTKLVCWSNNGVDKLNSYIRYILHGDKINKEKYILKDKVILTKPLININSLDRIRDKELYRLHKESAKLTTFFCNAKAEILHCTLTTVTLNEHLEILCYKIVANCENQIVTFYEIKDSKDLSRVGDYYEHIAWGMTTPQARQKAYERRHFILSCFVELKHYFAATAHRLQGATVNKVIVMSSELNKNMNIIERGKCRYVACSRASEELMYYRGFSL